MIPVSLDCPFLIGPSVFSNVYLLSSLSCALLFPKLPVSLDCIFLIAPSNFSNVYLLSTVCPVSCVPYIATVSGLYIPDFPESLFSFNLSFICIIV